MERSSKRQTSRSTALDLSARGGKKVESIPDAILQDVLAKLAVIFE
jgi:hypothetical protein